jgi:hypothetical protein
MPTATADDKSIIARFARRNRDTGAEEAVFIEAGDFNGRQLVHLKLWAHNPVSRGRRGDCWHETTRPVTIREHELDEVIAALEAVRKVVHGEGRSTEADPRRRVDQPSRPAPARRLATQPARAVATAKPNTSAPIPVDPDSEDAPF